MSQFQKKSVQNVLFACALAAFASSAKADIVQCIDAKGSVAFTDTPCRANIANAVIVRASGTGVSKPAGRFIAARHSRTKAAKQSRSKASSAGRSPDRRFPLDVATMKAARVAMHSNDQVADLRRQQVLLQQSTRPGFWEFWRS